MKLSEHFTLEEMIVSEYAARNNLNNYPNESIISEMRRLAEFLEKIRLIFNSPISINSAYRSTKVNEAIGGQKSSQHCKGQAADIHIQGLTPRQVCQKIIELDLPFDQLIQEYYDPKKGSGWVHISIPEKEKPPRKMALIIDKNGTKPFK